MAEEEAVTKEQVAALSRTVDELKVSLQDYKAAMDKVDTNATEGAKAVILLNSGAIAAMLGFMQSLVGKSEAVMLQFKPFGLLGLIGFLLGATITAVVFAFQAHGSLVSIDNPRELLRWRTHSMHTVLLGLGIFIFSAAIVVVGISVSF